MTTGFVGVALLLGSVLSGVALIARAYRRGHRTAAMWLTLSWVAITIDNITEADFMIPGPLWFTYCLVYFLTYAELRRAEQGRQLAWTAAEPADLTRTLPAYAFALPGAGAYGLHREGQV